MLIDAPDLIALDRGDTITVQLLGGTNRAATGKPVIGGTAALGQELTVDLGDVADADGLPGTFPDDYTFQWMRVDPDGTTRDIFEANSSTLTLYRDDKGLNIQVEVGFTDGGGFGETVVSDPVGPVVEVLIGIVPEHPSIGAGIEDLVFTLTREGQLAGALEATVEIDQDQPWLESPDLTHTVTFTSQSSTATVTLAADKFSFDPDTSGDLTATVSGTDIAGGSATVTMISIADPPITISLDQSSYTFAEDAGAADVEIYVVVTLDPAYPQPASRLFFFDLSTEADTADTADYVDVAWNVRFHGTQPGGFEFDGDRFVWRAHLRDEGGEFFAIVNDDVYEGSERLVVKIESAASTPAGLIQFANPDGTTCQSCVPEYEVIITDEEDAPALSLGADPASIAEEDDSLTTDVAENVSTLTVSSDNGKTFPTEQTITLTFAGSAVYGTHYSVTPVDADGGAAGHQVTLPAGTASVQVTVTAAANNTDDGNRSIEVTGSRDGTAFGNATIALTDDDTTNAAATGKPVIGGTAEVGETLTADISGIRDTDGIAGATFTYQWIRVAQNLVETPISGATSSTYTLAAADEGKKIKVKVSFTDDAGYAESLTSDSYPGTGTIAPETTNAAATGKPVIGGTAEVGETLTADISGIRDTDGIAGATFTYQWIRVAQNLVETQISGATSSTYTLAAADEGKKIKVKVSFTDDAGYAESLTSDSYPGTGTIAPETTDPLTLTVEAVDDEVTEGEPVRYRIVMSKPTRGVEVEAVYRYRGEFLRHDPSSTITGIRSRRGVLYWEVERQTLDDAVDEADGRFTVRLRPGDGYKLGTPLVARVTIRDNDPEAVSPPVVSVADATVEEGTGPLAFRVTLDRAPVETATVDWETLNGSAKAGKDYVGASGTLEFRPGQRSKTIRVAVLDDSHDEGNEVMLLYLPNAVGAIIADAVAKGTISNSDPMPRALMARFGRTAAVHVVEHVEERLAAPREVGVEAQVAGRQLRPGMERELALDFLRQLGSSAGMHAPGAGSGAARSGSPMGAAAGSIGLAAGMGGPAGGGMGVAADPMNGRASPDGGLFDRGLRSMGLGVENLLTSSSFALTRETRQGGILSFWSRGARSSFAGREEALSLGGDVRTTMVGADYAKGPLVAGLSLSHSRGLGEYVGVTGGQVASSVTGLYPWLGYQVTDRVSVWGVTGYGAGGLLLTPNGGPALRSGLSMAMAAAGTRGELVAGGAGGFALAFKADALWVGTSIDGVDGAAGRLAATDAAVTRFRTGLEGSRAYTLAGRLSLRPSVEVGLRHDGGDAETGAGMDVGGGLVVSDSSTGLAVDLRVRMLVMHQAEGFRERGLALSLSYNPTPSTPLGLTARVAPSWGGQATSGAEALWGRETMAGLAPGAGANGTRLAAEVGYGLPVGRRFVGTPTVGVGTAADGRDYRLGYRLGALGGEGTTVELGVEAQRRERPRQAGTDHGARARATLRW